MPKLKSHKGAAKRFKVSAKGKVKMKSAGARHILTKKNRKNKRQKGFSVINSTDAKMLKKLAPCV